MIYLIVSFLNLDGPVSTKQKEKGYIYWGSFYQWKYFVFAYSLFNYPHLNRNERRKSYPLFDSYLYLIRYSFRVKQYLNFLCDEPTLTPTTSSYPETLTLFWQNFVASFLFMKKIMSLYVNVFVIVSLVFVITFVSMCECLCMFKVPFLQSHMTLDLIKITLWLTD